MSTMNMKPNRIALFLAKILGKPEGENIKPSNATEYYLNELAESGGGGGAFFVTDNNNTLDKTWAEISSASENGVVLLKLNNKLGYLMDVGHGEAYGCIFMIAVTDLHGTSFVTAFRNYATSAENGYPVYE